MIDNPNDAFAQYEAQAHLRAQLAREVTPLNKAALFAVLQAAREPLINSLSTRYRNVR